MNKEDYKEQMGKLIEENSRLKDKVKELETELYFTNRNNKIVDERDISDEKYEHPYIYESPDNGKTIYKRRIGSDDKERLDI